MLSPTAAAAPAPVKDLVAIRKRRKREKKMRTSGFYSLLDAEVRHYIPLHLSRTVSLSLSSVFASILITTHVSFFKWQRCSLASPACQTG